MAENFWVEKWEAGLPADPFFARTAPALTPPAAALRKRALFSSIRQLGRLSLIVALLLSGGAHWFALQSVAWTAMLVTRARETSLAEAVKTTFDGAHPCSLCGKIEQGRRSEKPHDGPVLMANIELFYEASPAVLHPPPPAPWLVAPPLAAHARTQLPGLPPPRLG